MMHPTTLSRRTILTGIGGAALTLPMGTLALAQSSGTKKIVLVILRGAMDGLAAVAPYTDPAYAAARGAMALPPPGAPGGVLPISEGFGLHPRLSFLYGEWQARRLAICHAACSPYRSRSHFDGQDVLETGGATVFGLTDGWMNRALALLPATTSGPLAVAVGTAAPTVLKGAAPITSWTPPIQPAVPTSTLARLTDLYAGDHLLSPALASAIDTASLIADDGDSMMMGAQGAGAGGYRLLASAAARILAAPGGPAAAVISLDGWDTHANQGAVNGGLALRLQALDGALATLKQELGDVWADTAVIIATEFGRTVAANGTGGTDHGAGGAAFLLGGGVNGGRFLGEWPTLAPAALYEGRDLAPVNDVRAVFAGVLQAQWGLDAADLRRRIFPDSASMRPFERLLV